MGIAPSFDYSYGLASLIDFFVLLVSSIVAFQSYKIFKLVREKKYKLFTIAFSSMALAQLFKILSNITIFYRAVIQRQNFVMVLFRELSYMQLANFISFILYKTFVLVGFLLLFLIVVKTKNKSEAILLAYLSLMIIIFSIYYNLVFHLTIAVILLTLVMHFYQNYKKIGTKNSQFVFSAFVLIFFGAIIAIFTEVYPISHLIGEVFLLLGFIVLFVNQLSINNLTQKNGKKTNKDRSGKRHTGSAKK